MRKNDTIIVNQVQNLKYKMLIILLLSFYTHIKDTRIMRVVKTRTIISTFFFFIIVASITKEEGNNIMNMLND